MKKDVYRMIVECLICQRHKYQTISLTGLLQPLPIPTRIWEDIAMDFIIGLPCSKGTDAILVVVDRLSKHGHFSALKHTYSISSVAILFIKEVVRLHGVPNSIVSDRDPVFISRF